MKISRYYLLFILLLLSSLLASCAGGTSTATSWPGVTVDPDGETIYLAYNTHVYAINLSNGTEKWRYPAEADNKITFFAAPALTEDNQLVVGGYDHLFYSLNRETGGQNWTFDRATNRYIASPLVYGVNIYAPNSDNNLYVLNESGNSRWEYETEHAQWGKPVTDGEYVYTSSMDHHLYALEIETGELVWKSEDLGGAIAGSPTLSPQGVLYIGTFGSELVALDAQDGRVLWRTPATAWVWTGPAQDGDTLYFGDLSGSFFAVNAEDGSVLWQIQPEESPISDRPLVVDDTVYFVVESGTLYAVDAANGAPRWNKSVENGKLYTTPVAAEETILIAPVGIDAVLIAFDINGTQKWAFVPEK